MEQAQSKIAKSVAHCGCAENVLERIFHTGLLIRYPEHIYTARPSDIVGAAASVFPVRMMQRDTHTRMC